VLAGVSPVEAPATEEIPVVEAAAAAAPKKKKAKSS